TSSSSPMVPGDRHLSASKLKRSLDASGRPECQGIVVLSLFTMHLVAVEHQLYTILGCFTLSKRAWAFSTTCLECADTLSCAEKVGGQFLSLSRAQICGGRARSRNKLTCAIFRQFPGPGRALYL